MLRHPVTLRLAAIIVLIVLLLVPLSLIGSVTSERASRRNVVLQEISTLWGGAQEVAGPLVTIPYCVPHVDQDKITRPERHTLYVGGQKVRITTTMTTEMRRRAIYEVPVYTARVKVTAEIVRPPASAFGGTDVTIAWDQARLAFGLSDPKGIAATPQLAWGGQPLVVQPASAGLAGPGVGALVPNLADVPDGQVIPVEFSVVVRGSRSFSLAPLGDAVATLESTWPSPSFNGALLPAQYRVSASGTSAEWKMSSFGQTLPHLWRDDELATSDASARLRIGAFGVGLATPVDIYQQADRSTKYGVLFIALTFLAFFIVETLYGVSVHPVQYLMAGAALCLFYLLLLSLSEHLPFTLSYVVAAGATTTLVGAYGRTMLGARKPAASTAGLLASLYACLYVLLQLEDYALLTGSLALFVILALSMFVTRSVDWYAGRRAEAA